VISGTLPSLEPEDEPRADPGGPAVTEPARGGGKYLRVKRTDGG